MPRKQATRGVSSRLRGFDAFVRRQMKAWSVPGAAIGIVKNGQVIYAEGHGLRDMRRGLPVTERTTFAIGSCTKAFTATAAGLLVDDGKLDWDTPVREYLPSFRLHDPIATELMTLRDLLTHRSGVPRHDMVWVGTPLDRSGLFERLRHLQPSKSFRSKYQYSNLMFMAAGVVIERAAGCSWEEFVQRRILEPLGMSSVTFSNVAMAAGEDFALGYDRRGKRVVRVPHENIVPVGPAGAINTNVLDMCRWATFQMNKGKVGRRQIIKAKTLQTIHAPHQVFPQEHPYPELLDPAYALGWSVEPYRGRRRLTHGGCVDGFNARISFMPDASIGVVVFTNVTGSPLIQLLSYNAFDRLLGLDEVNWSARLRRQEKEEKKKKRAEARKARTRRERGTRPSHALEAYVGDYEHPGYGTMTITLENRKLKATYNGHTRSLEHYHYDQFGMVFRGTWPSPDKRVTFHVAADGRIGSLSAALQEGVNDIVFKRKRGHSTFSASSEPRPSAKRTVQVRQPEKVECPLFRRRRTSHGQ